MLFNSCLIFDGALIQIYSPMFNMFLHFIIYIDDIFDK